MALCSTGKKCFNTQLPVMGSNSVWYNIRRNVIRVYANKILDALGYEIIEHPTLTATDLKK